MDFQISEVDRSGKFPLAFVTVPALTDIPLYGIGDVHRGHRAHDAETLLRVITKIRDEGALWIGTGDWIENGSKRSIGDSWNTQTQTPQQQIDDMIELLKPIAHQCIGAVKGNHEFRSEREMGIDPMQIICYALDIPYFGDIMHGIIRAERGDNQHGIAYSFCAMHTEMASKTQGLDENAMERDVFSAHVFDIMIKGHSHYYYVSPPIPYYTMDFPNKSVVERTRRIWATGNYLRWESSYAMKKPYKPIQPGTIMLHLSMGRQKAIRAEEV